MVSVLKERQVLHPKRIWQSPTQLFTCVYNCLVKENEFIEIHPEHNPDEIFTLIKASCDLPYLAPGAVTYRGNQYKDTRDYPKNFLPMVFSQPMTDFVVIYNRLDQRLPETNPPKNTFEIMPPDDNLKWYEIRGHVLSGAARKMHNHVLKLFEAVV
jgi:hypothetical protein